MLFVPSDKPFDYRQPPRLSLALAALLLFLFVWLIPTEQNQKAALHEQYRQNLLTIEWPLYPTHLLPLSNLPLFINKASIKDIKHLYKS
jgi:hypothetical protein